MRIIHSKSFLYTEMVVFMLGVPLLMLFWLPSSAILPMIWLMAVLCHFITNASNGWRKENWWNRAGVTRAELTRMLKRFVLCAAALSGLTYAFAPELLFGFVREKPLFWLIVMVMYPLISVVPQEIIFRRYMFDRYKTAFSPRVLVLVSGVGFGFAHIVFGNWVAPVLCVIGGIMFAQTYARTRSLALVSLEHALYGDFIFTLGLGRYFYHGAVH
jgi:uncharacterized protein